MRKLKIKCFLEKNHKNKKFPNKRQSIFVADRYIMTDDRYIMIKDHCIMVEDRYIMREDHCIMVENRCIMIKDHRIMVEDHCILDTAPLLCNSGQGPVLLILPALQKRAKKKLLR